MSIHVAIIGAYGSAGTAVADRLVDVPDVELTLIDDGEPGGGLCILRGCMPSKEVLSAGAHRFQARHDHRTTGTPEVDLDAVVETKDEHISNFAEHRRGAVHDWAGRDHVTFIHETARFVDDETLAVGDETITPDYIIVATGSTINMPDLPGIDDVDVMTSADVLDATDFPERGVVMGFGYIGMEMVPYLSEAAEMDITVIEHDERPLDEADPVFGDAALDIYREQFGIEVRTEIYEERVEQTAAGGVALTLDDGTTVTADQLFCFTGRKPTLEGLGLEKTSLNLDEDLVADTMQARDSDHVFVAGDANGKEPILHVAKEQGHQAAANILAHARGDALEPYQNVHHHVMFSGLGVYPYARVGHNEQSAREAGYDVAVATRAASDDGVFKTKDVPEGLARLVVDRTNGTVLGYQGLHYHADAMAKTMQIVVETGMDVRDVPDRSYHPTTPEIIDGLLRECASAVADD